MIIRRILPVVILAVAASAFLFSSALAQTTAKPVPAPQKSAPSKRARLVRAFVIDDRLSALRREADIQAEVTRRVRLARPVYLTEVKGGKAGGPKFHRVAVTRRTRGWMHEAAIAVPGRPGDDARLLKMVETMGDDFDRLTLCRLFVDWFGYSRLLPRALMIMAREAERAAAELSRNAQRRLKSLDAADAGASERDYYLSDTGVDRYTRLRIRFDYLEKTGEYIYDGQAYREVARRFPQSEEAAAARRQWEATRQRLVAR